MKFSVERKKILDSVRIVQKGVSKSSQSTILEGILFDLKNNILTLSSTDLRVSVKTQLEVNSLEEGSYVINSTIISEILRKLDTEIVDFYIDENFTLHIKSGKFNTSFSVFHGDEFPVFPKYIEDDFVTINSDVFFKMLKVTKSSVSQDETRLIYTGVNIKIKNNLLEAVSLDGYRISVFRTNVESDTEINIIIPLYALNIVEKMIKEDDKIVICKSNNQAVFKIDDTILLTRIFEGEFLDYNPLVNFDGNTVVELKRKLFYNVLDRNNILSRGNLNLVELEIKDTTMEVISSGEFGNTKENFNIFKNGNDVEIAFNGRYLREGLELFEDDDLKIVIIDNLSPMTLLGKEDNSIIHVILPVRKNG